MKERESEATIMVADLRREKLRFLRREFEKCVFKGENLGLWVVGIDGVGRDLEEEAISILTMTGY